MAVLDDKKKLGSNDFVSFRVVEDRDNESQRLRVNDNGELEVPYIGLVQAAGKSCKELAYAIKAALEREYYYHATVIIAVDHISEKSRGRSLCLWLGQRRRARRKFRPDETYTVSKAIIRAGGFGDFANKRKVKVTRKERPGFCGRSEARDRRRPHRRRRGPATGRSDLCAAASDQHVAMQARCSTDRPDLRPLDHCVHHAAPSLQVAAAAALVDSGSDDLPRAVCPGLADLPDAALLSFHEQDDARRQTEHQPKRGLQRRQRQFLRHADPTHAERGSAAQRRSARPLDPSGNAAGPGRRHGRRRSRALRFSICTRSAARPITRRPT